MIGWLRDHSRIDSTKSIEPRIGPLQVLEDHDRRAANAATRSKNVRQAEKSSSRSPGGASASPSRWARRGSIQLSLVGIGDELGDRGRRAWPGTRRRPRTR